MANSVLDEQGVDEYFAGWRSSVGPFRAERARAWLEDSALRLAKSDEGGHVFLVDDAGAEQDPREFFAALGLRME